ncbi:hypothetical protein PG993_004780 [Apiospora rasikravindrae]|uniref:Uncharacterized protein n=1 Tax=Apiospora rasikravindrae TaxID=990691 RepID=A0ABR1TDQ3_9PEZI
MHSSSNGGQRNGNIHPEPSTESTGGEGRDTKAGDYRKEHHRRRDEHRRQHHHQRTSTSHKYSSSSGERRSGNTHAKPHSSSSQQHHPHPRHSSSRHHKSRGVSKSSSSSSKPLPRVYTSYKYGSSAARDAESSSAVPASSQPPPPPVSRRGDLVPPSTAPTIPEEEEEEEDEDMLDRRASMSVGPWDSISVAGLNPDQYQAYLAAAKEQYQEPGGEADAAATTVEPIHVPSSSSNGRSRRQHHSHQGTSYSSSHGRSSNMPPPPRYSHGSEVPWQDSAYHSGIGNRISASSQTRQLPAYTSHDYVHNQQQEQPQPAVASYRAVEPRPGYTMNSAYRTMPGYEDSGYGYHDGYDGAVGNGDVVEESDRMNFQFEEDGERRRVRGSRERTVRRSSGESALSEGMGSPELRRGTY